MNLWFIGRSLAGITLIGGFCLIGWVALKETRIHDPRLVSFDRLPPEAAEECDHQPVAAQLPPLAGKVPLRAALLQERVTAAADAGFAQRKPERIIRDPYAAYSAVAVDNTHNEVVLTDENLFNILTYDRQVNTRPTSVTDPKRIIGGLNTKIEFQCGLYIDPANGDIYAVNNDTIDTLVIFSRQAIGNVTPDRELHTPHGTFGIAVDEDAKELFLTVQHDNAIVVFNKTAQGAEAPIRVIQGDDTALADPHGMAIDRKNRLLYVTNHGSVHEVRPPVAGEKKRRVNLPGWPLTRDDAVPGSGKMLPPSITVYAKDAKGNARPVRTIQGTKTQMDWPTGIAVDYERNEIFVANDGGNSMLVFAAAASGDVAPLRVLKGLRSLISNPTGVYLDKKNNELWVSNFGNHTAAVYSPTAQGDTAPLRVIRSAPPSQPVPGMGNPHPIAYDTKREEILVPN